MPKPPPHLDERVFRRYERVIGSILNKWPEPSEFSPHPYQPTTFGSGLRNAIRSVLLYKWPTPLDLTTLEEVRGDLQITISQEGFVRAARKAVVLDITPLEPQVDESQRFTKAEVYAALVLLSGRRLRGPLRLDGWLVEDVKPLIGDLDVQVFEEQGKTIIV